MREAGKCVPIIDTHDGRIDHLINYKTQYSSRAKLLKICHNSNNHKIWEEN